MPTILTIAAVRLLDPNGHILLVRKRGTDKFMQPGGKLEPGEAPLMAAIREVAEETGIRLAPAQLEFLGRWRGPAANEADTLIEAHLFAATTAEPAIIAAEIEEMIWIDPAEALLRPDLAPLLSNEILPGLLRA
ncbi:NUDIX hydrolase [Paeniglutamicibacter cryotolerans]|uniref:8-oxo-dGTP pyrophosphatase MutT (NUDIX family) n=1 Tax=Paeniglutamicibacter cryotolerans TaxID=670079 RepID=A0A839QI25_9MICC|nr:NUDIX domain-containing protein [Paeniglutamicibacter cryotolerans]MBB2995427.1 8-oxo-dGTP pyrophosphatase MutT (NUDIX family) [Paeniglutamicibacter cryotolerans]